MENKNKLGANTPEGLVALHSLTVGNTTESATETNTLASMIADIKYAISVIVGSTAESDTEKSIFASMIKDIIYAIREIEEICIPESIKKIFD